MSTRTDKYVDNRHCDNSLIENNKEYKLEKIWRAEKSDYDRDSKGKLFPYPKINEAYWPDKHIILDRIASIGILLETNKKILPYDEPKNCLICGKKKISTKRYNFMNIMWDNGLFHYIDVHNIEPSIQFKQIILDTKITPKLNNLYRNISSLSLKKAIAKTKKISNRSQMILARVVKDKKEYVMIDRNQMLILDALMIHGGYSKKYIDQKKDFSRYSEHAGFLAFEGYMLSNIIVSGKTYRLDEDDDDIYLPMGMDGDDMIGYKYIFHTHPPTPKPGGRVNDGVLYEFPSIGDIFHFINHHNSENIIGSLVVTAEGLYNIRKASSDINDIKINDDDLYEKYQKIFNQIQRNAILQYGTEFTTKLFYTEIAQNTSYINKINNVLNKFDIHIDYYPRKKNIQKKWIIDTVFLAFRDNIHNDR
jgi:hypothetical protein